MSLMTDKNNAEVIGFIASTVESMRDQIATMQEQMATKSDIAQIKSDMATKNDITILRGDIEQVQLRLDGIEHSVSSRFEHVEGEISRLRSALYVLGKDRPDVLRLLGSDASADPAGTLSFSAHALTQICNFS
jgi:hypothetical protein